MKKSVRRIIVLFSSMVFLLGCAHEASSGKVNSHARVSVAKHSTLSTDPSDRRRPPRSLVYHNSEFDFTFSLPSYWAGYSVQTNEWQSAAYLSDADQTEVTERGPMIVFRNPYWTVNDPRQDIPILVFTRRQWEKYWQPQGFSVSAGGIEEEIAHNDRYVFVINSRFNWGDLPGAEDAGRIVDENRAANQPHLREE
ncbi:MAG TPA: hypothetical protein VFV81_07890 [Verrucomicrobiae bacterium]|nr:hypothetical protein [Verrucomicrobiae bacterium]